MYVPAIGEPAGTTIASARSAASRDDATEMTCDAEPGLPVT